MAALPLPPPVKDPGPHDNGRYSNHMLPEVELKDFRKGAQIPIALSLLRRSNLTHRSP
ncbi:hypothetical protein Fmac_008092 [Flemingia macrophylla]|uniref:Uncharacterized protein n=1 Tax=Flemingia macrophylla TaxID=520843 RepID=A0ABD1MWE5_9FABA